MFPRLAAVLTVLGLLGCGGPRTSAPAPRLAPVVSAAPTDFEPAGVGSLQVRASSGDTSLARLVQVHVTARQLGDMAEIEASHIFRNDSDAALEGTFRFPLPDGALLTGLSMMIDGKLMEGELVEREKARKTYEAIVDGMQDPALLEWEHGSLFKMRVFPLEPGKDKVVVVRYLAPLRRDPDGLRFVQSGRGVGDGELLVDWQGQRLFQGQNLEADHVVQAPARAASAVLREVKANASYGIVRLSPDWSRIPAPNRPLPRSWFIVVDTSRSALEELPKELEALEVLLRALPAGANFHVVTSDLDARPAPQGLQPVTPAAIRDALDFVRSVTPDGASDLGRAIDAVGRLAASAPDSALIYLGDGEPTWGLVEPAELVAELHEHLPKTAVYPVLLGSSVNDELAEELARASGGRRARVRRREDLEAFAGSLTRPLPSLSDVELTAPVGTELLTLGARSLEPNRDLLLFIKAPAGRDPLQGVGARARLGGVTLDLMPRAAAENAEGVARRYGAALVKELEKKSQPAPQIVQASLEYGVMSKLTSFLVLESEEAYARFAIERRQPRATDSPRVTGVNLESTEGADISADRVQPGDPEIYVDAPRDAASVTVELPFGQTKVARYDEEARGGRGAWLVRFLVPLETPEGRYEAAVRVQRADGSVETRKVSYEVDNTGPELVVRLSPAPRRTGWLEVTVTDAGDARLSDLKRVELMTPAGTIHPLTPIRWGVFRAFVPSHELSRGTLRVVGFDQALNHTVKEISVP